MNKRNTLGERMQSACRLRQIRENADLTQEQFSEILGISVSTYKKVESGENQVSIASLSNLYKKMNVSTDYILFGKKKDVEETWQTILNCTEQDKLFLLLRLLAYFTKIKHGIFPLENEQAMEDKNILQLIRELQDYGE